MVKGFSPKLRGASSSKDLSFDFSLWQTLLKQRYQQREKNRLAILEKLLPQLREYFKTKKVKGAYLFGSLLKEGQFYEFSDIDIAVEGLKEDYFTLSCEIERLIDRDVDLVELEKCKFKDFVKKHGLKIK